MTQDLAQNKTTLDRDDLQDPVVSDNAARVLANRYLAKDDKGEIVEDPKGMYMRVAWAIAEPEEDRVKWATEFYDMMACGDFLPNSPTLMNAGRQLGMLSACQPYNAPVLTKEGYRPIGEIFELISNGDEVEVSNGTGCWTKVLAAKHNGKKLVLDITLSNGRSLQLTEDHLLPAGHSNGKSRVEFDWVEARELRPGMYLQPGDQANPQSRVDQEELDMASVVGWLLTDGGTYKYHKNRFVGEIQTVDPASRKHVEGALTRLGINFSSKQDPSVDSVEEFTRIRSYDSTLEDLAHRFETFDRKTEKHLAREIHALSVEAKREFLRTAFEADGYVSTQGVVGFQSVSETFSRGIQEMLDLFGIYSSLSEKEDRRENRLNGWCLTIARRSDISKFESRIGFISHRKRNKLAALPNRRDYINKLRVVSVVRKAEPEDVYDIQTSARPDGTYVTNGVLVHNCFVLPVEDNIGSIMSANTATALVQRAGGGTGFSFSKLRPNGSVVSSSGGTTSGPLAFIDMFSATTASIQQGAFRRGANMAVMAWDHPDIVDFINAKEDLKRWQNYNVSVSVTDDFMELLVSNPLHSHEIEHPKWGQGAIYKKRKQVKAFRYDEDRGPGWHAWTIQDTWDLICKRAHATGEPGLFFYDQVNRNNPIKASCGPIEACNPCGEQNLHPWDSCNLGSINLSRYVTDGYVDWERLRGTIEVAVRFLDDVIDVNNYPIPEIEEMSKKTRRIGLGVMGFADLLFMLRISYNSEDARQLGAEIMAFMSKVAEDTSCELALEKGNFGAWEGSDYQLHAGDHSKPMRNSFRTTVAPTGTISIIANCSGGIEPLFALAFTRTVMADGEGVHTVMEEFNPHFRSAVEKSSLPDRDKKALLDHALKHGEIGSFDWIAHDNGYIGGKRSTLEARVILTDVFKTSHEIPYLDHVEMQAAWQEFVDTAISKTINLSRNTTPTDVSAAYMLAWKSGCKGITVYRDGCRDNVEGMKQPMAVKKEPELVACDVADTMIEPISEAPSEVLYDQGFDETYAPAIRTRYTTPWGNLHMSVVLDDACNQELEIFAQIGKAGDLIAADIEGLCRVASLHLRNGGTLEDIIGQWEGIGSSHVSIAGPDGRIASVPDAIAKSLKKYRARKGGEMSGSSSASKDRFESAYGTPCPSCETGRLEFSEGCQKCRGCGYSAC